MKYLIDMHLSLSKDLCEARIEKLIDRESLLNASFPIRRDKHHFVGRIGEKGFRIHIPSRSSFKPYLYGRIVPERGGVRIVAWTSIHPLVKPLLLIGGMTTLYLIGSEVLRMVIWQGKSEQSWEYVFVLPWCVLFVLVLWLCSKPLAADHQDLLKELILDEFSDACRSSS